MEVQEGGKRKGKDGGTRQMIAYLFLAVLSLSYREITLDCMSDMLGQASCPGFSLCVEPEGGVWAFKASGDSSSLMLWSPDGKIERRFNVDNSGSFSTLSCGKDRLYLSQSAGPFVRIIDKHGNHINTITLDTSRCKKYHNPSIRQIGDSGILVCALNSDSLQNRFYWLMILNNKGQLLNRLFPVSDYVSQGYIGPYTHVNAAVDSEGRIYAGESTGHIVFVFKPNGELVDSFGVIPDGYIRMPQVPDSVWQTKDPFASFRFAVVKQPFWQMEAIVCTGDNVLVQFAELVTIEKEMRSFQTRSIIQVYKKDGSLVKVINADALGLMLGNDNIGNLYFYLPDTRQQSADISKLLVVKEADTIE